MKKIIILVLMLFTSEIKATDYQLYYLGGQSNMEGFGFTQDLSADYQSIDNGIMIFNGNQSGDDTMTGGFGTWMPLSPGFGTGYQATEDTIELSNRFGPELSFGKSIAKLTNKKVAIIKYARGGSSLALGASGYGTWAKDYDENTGINQWDNFDKTVSNAFKQKDIDGDGTEDRLIPAGIIWMQGEADAYNEAASKVYFENLSVLMRQITARFGVDKLPIVLGRIEDSGQTKADRVMPFIEAVWKAQAEFAEANDNVSLVKMAHPIEFLKDKWHYKSRHYLELGNLFAEAIYSNSLPKVVSGHIKRINQFQSKFVTPRNIDVWLPENYDPKNKYSVLYMHDGQMLFDPSKSWNKQSWNVDNVISALQTENKISDLIVVGIWNGGETRHIDYFPQKPYESLTASQKNYVTNQLIEAGRAVDSFVPVSDNYLKFLVSELKPYIEKSYSVHTDREHNFIAGSSMGGLISIYALCEYPEEFGGSASLSTHWPGIFSLEKNPIPDAFFEYLKKHLPKPGNHKIYFDYGDQTLDAMYPSLQQKVDDLMITKGYSKNNFHTQFFPGQGHSESAWNERLHIPLLFLLGK
jgi:predicted alpha/beta superfamily hydrolase